MKASRISPAARRAVCALFAAVAAHTLPAARALKFAAGTGSGSQIKLNGSIANTFSQPFTIECWVRPTSFANNGHILDQHQQSHAGRLQFNITKTAGKPQIRIGANTVTAPDALALNEWSHLAATRDANGNVALYVNAVQVAAGTEMTNALPSGATYPFVLGNLQNTANTYLFRGEIADVRVWYNARTADEIAANRTRRLTGGETNLKYCWPLDDGDGTTLRQRRATSSNTAGTINANGDQITWTETMLPLVIGRETLDADRTDAILLGKATLAAAGAAGTTRTLSGGLTIDPGPDAAGVIRVEEGVRLDVAGAVSAVSGGFVKTRGGTLALTGSDNATLAHQAQNKHAVLDLGEDGEGPSTGFHSCLVADGTLAVDRAGATVRIGANGLNRLVVGAMATNETGAVQSGHFVVSGGTVTCGILYVGLSSDTNVAAAVTAATPTSTVTVAGGTLAVNPASSVRLGCANGALRLAGGVLEAPEISRAGTWTNGLVAIDFDGGTWKPNATKRTVVDEKTFDWRIGVGGAVFDCSGMESEFVTTVPFVRHPDLGAAADGGLTIAGGSLSFKSANCTYTGPTTVKSGATLVTSAASGKNNLSTAVVEAGGTLTVVDSKSTATVAGLDLRAGGTLKVLFSDDGASNSIVAVNKSTPVLAGRVAFAYETDGAAFGECGTYTILEYTGDAPDVSALVAVNLPERREAVFRASGGKVTARIRQCGLQIVIR